MKHLIDMHNNGTARDMGIKVSDVNLKILKVAGGYGKTAAIGQLAYDLEKLKRANNGLRAVDSVTLRENNYLEDPRAGGLLKRSLLERAKGFEIVKYTGWLQTRTGAWIFIMYLPWTRSGGSYLYFSFSVPKVIQGNNFTNIQAGTDIITILNIEFIPVFEQLKMEPQDISLWECRGIDIGLNFQVGDKLPFYLAYLETRQVPHRRRIHYNDYRPSRRGEDNHNNGVVFASRGRGLVAYDKGLESGNPLAQGELRLEDQIRRAKSVQRLFGSKYPRLIDFTTNIAQKVLNNDFTLTGLNNQIISVKDVREELAKRLPKQPGLVNKIMGLIDLERRHPGLNNRQLHEALGSGLSAWTIGKLRRELKKTGVSYMVDETISLPALNLHVLDETCIPEDGIVGCGEDSGREGVEGATNVTLDNLPAVEGQISIPTPQIIAFIAEHQDILASELFGVPTIVVSPAPQVSVGIKSDGVMETPRDSELLVEPVIGEKVDPEIPEDDAFLDISWRDNLTDSQLVAAENDFLIELFFRRHPQPAKPPVQTKKRDRR